MKRRRQRKNFWKRWAEQMEEWDLPRGSNDPREWQTFFQGFMGVRPGDHWLFGGRRFKPWQMGDVMFNPFVSALLSKRGGLLPLYTLHLLSREPRYGNEIITELAERTDHQGMVNPAAVYPLLADMEGRGFVVSEWQDPVKRTTRRYTITETGRDELGRLKALMQPKLREAIEVLKDMLDDLEDIEEEL